MANQYSITPGGAFPGSQVSIDSTRRKFNLGDKVYEIAPNRAPFQVYLNRLAKESTPDPVFKFLERRHSWARRYMYANDSQEVTADGNGYITIKVHTDFDKYGRTQSTDQLVPFVLPKQIIRLRADFDYGGDTTYDGEEVVNAKVLDVTQNSTDTDIQLEILNPSSAMQASTTTVKPIADLKYNIVGSAHAEAADTPDAWSDLSLYPSEGFTQIFRTACPMMSGTSMATQYRGIANEFKRIWTTKLIEHWMDRETASLFGVGRADEGASGGPERHTWGIVPYTEANGKTYKVEWDQTYGNESTGYYSGDYDGFLEIMENFYDPEIGNSGTKLALASRSVITWLNRLGTNSFLANTVGTSQYQLNIQQVQNPPLRINVTRVETIHGSFDVVQEPLFRGVNDNMMMLIDLANVKWRPLAANGVSRDTFIETNVQNPGVDGRQDQILTEGGLQIDLPETHAKIQFGNKGTF